MLLLLFSLAALLRLRLDGDAFRGSSPSRSCSMMRGLLFVLLVSWPLSAGLSHECFRVAVSAR